MVTDHTCASHAASMGKKTFGSRAHSDIGARGLLPRVVAFLAVGLAGGLVLGWIVMGTAHAVRECCKL